MLIFKEDLICRGYTCIVPSLGAGNVSQMSVDLIVATLQLKQVATGFHEALIPIFGPCAYNYEKNTSTHAMNAYVDENKKLLVFQIRSPLVARYKKDFLKKLCEFLKNAKVHQVIILGSCFLFEKHNVESKSIEYMSNQQFDRIFDKKIDLTRNTSETPIDGDGWGQSFLQACSASDIPAMMFFIYCYEGDNRPEAHLLAKEVDKYFYRLEKLIEPESWRLLLQSEEDHIKSMY